MIANDQEKEWMTPLLEFRNDLERGRGSWKKKLQTNEGKFAGELR